MRHVSTVHHHNTPSRSTAKASAILWLWPHLVISALLCLGFAPEGLAGTTLSPTALTYYAVQGATNPPSRTITVSKTGSSRSTLTASDNATWLSVSPTSTSITSSATLTVSVNTSGRIAGTYSAAITIKVGTWQTKTIPVTLIISSSTTPPSPTTSSATLTWDAITSTTVSGYKVYVGDVPSQWIQTINVGTVTSYTVNSLTVGKAYYFAVSAYNSAGESPLSTVVTKTIQ